MSLGLHNIHHPTHSRLAPRQFDYSERDVARFLAKVGQPTETGCWLWLASVMDRLGHGQFTARSGGVQRHFYAHRVAWELAHGPIPGGLVVCHQCDVPRCVNPAHLFLGTQADNLNDARAKGRLIDGLSARKLSDVAYRDIVASTASGVSLARQHGVTTQTIYRIRRGRQGSTYYRQQALEPPTALRRPVHLHFQFSHRAHQVLSHVARSV